jgi:hypothetical protein
VKGPVVLPRMVSVSAVIVEEGDDGGDVSS